MIDHSKGWRHVACHGGGQGVGRIGQFGQRSGCPAAYRRRLRVPFDAAALQHVLNALDPVHTESVTCGLALPVNGG